MESLFLNGITTERLFAEIRDIVKSEIAVLPIQEVNNKPFLSFIEACDFTGLSKSTMYRLTSENKIPHIKRGKLIFNREELTEWLQSGKINN